MHTYKILHTYLLKNYLIYFTFLYTENYILKNKQTQFVRLLVNPLESNIKHFIKARS